MFLSHKVEWVGLTLSILCLLIVCFVLYPMFSYDEVEEPNYAIMDVVQENLPALLEINSELDYEKPDFIRDNQCGYYFSSEDKNYLLLCTVMDDGKLNIDVQEVPS